MAARQKRDESYPATTADEITPNDNADITYAFSKGVWVGGTGDLRVIMINDTDPVTFTNVQGGSLLPIRVKRVMNTGTTATGITREVAIPPFVDSISRFQRKKHYGKD